MTKRSVRWAGALLALAVIGGACSNGSSGNASKPTGTGNGGTTAPAGGSGGLFPTTQLNQPQFVGTPSIGGTMTFGLESKVLTLDPGQQMVQPADLEVGTAIYDSMVQFNDKDQPAPFLAKSWTSSSDLKTWTFQLQQGVTFQPTNNPFNAAAVVAATKRSQAQPNCSCKTAADSIASVTATAPYTVVYQLKAPNVAFPVQLAGTLGMIVDAKAAASEGASFASKPVGTGPFVMQTYGNTITVTKNSKYWQKRDGVALPYLDKMIFKPLTDSKTRLAAVQSGGVDIMQTADTDNLVEAKKDPNLVIQPVTGSSSTILILNIKKPPFNDIRARQALNYGLNRIDLNQRAYQGARVPAYGFFPPTDPYYDPTAQLPAYDLTKAKALVSQLKSEGKSTDYTSLCIPTPEASNDFTVLKEQAKAAGTNVTLNTLDQASFVAALLGGKANYNVACFRSPQAADPDEFYSSLHTGGSTNIPGYSNPVVDKSLDQGRKYTDIATRRRLYNTVQKQVSKDVVFVPLLFDLYGNIHSSKTSGLSKPWPNSLGLINTSTLYFVK